MQFDEMCEAFQGSLSISVHKGLKIQDRSSGCMARCTTPLPAAPKPSTVSHKGALCIERPPLHIVEPAYNQKWRAFKEAARLS